MNGFMDFYQGFKLERGCQEKHRKYQRQIYCQLTVYNTVQKFGVS